jgi:subtilisin-like proprotein convertase family protein
MTLSGSTWTVNSTISVDMPFVPTDSFASLQIEYPDMSDLVVTLESPLGTEVTLLDNNASGSSLGGTYDSDLTPAGPGSMSDFDGQQAQGVWTLTVVDNSIPGGPWVGTLRGWSLTFVGPSCDSLVCEGDPVPDAVSDVAVGIENGADLHFDWSAVTGASGYRVWRSDAADFADEELVDAAGTTTLLAPGGVAGPTTFFQVRAVNACEWEGP